MCAYKVDTDDDPFAPAPGCAGQFNDAPYLGCYKDRNRRRALPYEVHGRPHSAEGCMNACNEAGYKYFARQWRGQCFCGNGVRIILFASCLLRVFYYCFITLEYVAYEIHAF